VFYSQRGDAKLTEIISKIQLMHKQFGGENPSTQTATATGSTSTAVVDAKELSLGQVIQLLQNLSEKVNSATDQFIEEFVETYGQPSASNMMYFQQGMLQLSERLVSNLLLPLS
jgi:Ni,Fe-hydrogenase I large subunit